MRTLRRMSLHRTRSAFRTAWTDGHHTRTLPLPLRLLLLPPLESCHSDCSCMPIPLPVARSCRPQPRLLQLSAMMLSPLPPRMRPPMQLRTGQAVAVAPAFHPTAVRPLVCHPCPPRRLRARNRAAPLTPMRPRTGHRFQLRRPPPARLCMHPQVSSPLRL